MRRPEFVPAQIYIRADLHKRYGGQAQGGISTPKDYPVIFLFTGPSGAPYGYRDGWSEDGVFFYTGEGQVGDMTFTRGNRAVRDHVREGKDLHLFELIGQGKVRYVGQMICIGFHWEQGADREGKPRKIIVFELMPLEAYLKDQEAVQALGDLWESSLERLRQRALESSSSALTSKERKARSYERSQAIRVYVLQRANGYCEGCGQPAPFLTPDGRPYLEPHHLRRLSDGGPDDPHWVIALCPNCHRRVHYGADGEEYNRCLVAIVHKKEQTL